MTSHQIPKIRSSSSRSLMAALIQAGAGLATWIGGQYTNRRALHEIARLNDRELCDIGLTRSDVTSALSFEDPELGVGSLSQRRLENHRNYRRKRGIC